MAVSLKVLNELHGVSGCEDSVRRCIKKEIAQFCDDIKTDSMGNLIAFRKGISSEKRILLGSNMDEPGFIVSGITDKGYIKVKSVGSADIRTVLSGRVITNKGVRGVTGIKAVHLQTKKERESAVSVSSLYIDIGCKKKETAEKRVALGDYIAFDTPYFETDETAIGKAMGRAGIMCLIEAIKEKPAYDTYYVFSAQHEIPCRIAGRGMMCAAYAIKPDAAVIIDSLATADVFTDKNDKLQADLGKGAVIEYMDRTSISDVKFTAALESVAKRRGVMIQKRICNIYSTEAGAVQTAADGCAVAVIGIPCRYKNTPSGMINKNDLKAAAMLCKAAVTEREVIADVF